MSRLRDMLARHEGYRQKLYRDTEGKLTGGYGHNFDAVGVSRAAAGFLLDEDIQTALVACVQAFPWFKRLNGPRQDAITDLVYNIGVERFQGFVNTIAALEAGDYEVAAQEMLRSKWARQVRGRSQELAQMIRTGAYVENAK